MLAVALTSSLTLKAGKVVDDSLYSNILSSEVRFKVYLPSGFNESGETYPVIYLLHGLWDDCDSWEGKGSMRRVANELMEDGESRRAIIIMPNAGGKPKDNPWYGYFNMPGWNYEDFFFKEFIPEVEKRYRCISDKAHRAIMGLSMGGGGSAVYAQRHPEMFSSCYIMSGWLDNSNNDVDSSESPKIAMVCRSVTEHSALDYIRNASPEQVKAMNTVKWMIDCGDDDFLLRYSIDFHFLMNKAGIKTELRVRNGIHNWEYWHLALRLALPFASRNFGK